VQCLKDPDGRVVLEWLLRKPARGPQTEFLEKKCCAFVSEGLGDPGVAHERDFDTYLCGS
jgi:hypothetical protein